ncbi:MAG: hypothetical protein EOP09_05200 [Proteobacteria bacterium]|nr:MAG: hypothetical protein EOP09_05200 [Pseudomonadota bacterium]
MTAARGFLIAVEGSLPTNMEIRMEFPVVDLKLRNDLHLARKIWHCGMGMIMMASYFFWLTRAQAMMWLATAFLFNLGMELGRLKSPELNAHIMKTWGGIMRSCEVNRVSGIPYYIGATLISVTIFPKPIAILSVVCLAVGDPIASLFGITLGDKSVRFSNGKSLIGTMAGVIACSLVIAASLLLFESYGMLRLNRDHFWMLSVIGGFAGGAAELTPMEIDDNFAIPVISGFVLWLVFILLQIQIIQPTV